MLSALSQAWASWKSAPGVAVLAVVAFAFGIGAATAVFTVINGVLLRPLPYPDGNRFVAIYGGRTTEPGTYSSLSVPELQDYEQRTTSFDVFGWFRSDRLRMTAPGDTQLVPVVLVTPGLARQLGSPSLGQWFVDDSSVVISTALWRRLGQPADIIGSGITLDGNRYTVTGVMPPSFRLPIGGTTMGASDTQVWIPLDPRPPDAERGNRINFAYARRKPGVSLEQARADVQRAAASIAADDPDQYPFYTAEVVALRESTLTNLRATLLTLLAGAGLLLLIACANVATLLLARAVVRARETAIRVALGARRRQLALRYFAEGALVSVAGAAAGIGLSAIFVRQILAYASEYIPHADEIAIDWTVLGFSVAVAIATGVLAGLAPLWQAMRTPPNAVLTEGVRASAGTPVRRLSQAFVVIEIALAFTLLTTSAILIVHVRNLNRATLGFDPANLVTFELVVPQQMTALPDAWRLEQSRLMEALRTTPGVASASIVNQLTTYPGCLNTTIYFDGLPRDATAQRVCFMIATPEYLSTMRIPHRAGALLTDEPPGERLPVLVNEAAVRRFWPDRDPIGASGRLSGPEGSIFDVVGVYGDVRNNGLNKPSDPEIYMASFIVAFGSMNIIVRADAPADQVIRAVRNVVETTTPALTVDEVSSMSAIISDTLQLERLSSIVMTLFGLVALLMATLGVYGVMSYFVRQRTVELGTRMALGAVNRDLVGLVLGGGLKLSLAGIAVGAFALAGAVALLARFLEVSGVGWLPYGASTIVIGFVAAAAASVPAWRTTLLSPMVAMREQPPSAWRWARQRMRRAVDDVRQAVAGDDAGAEVAKGDVLAAFVDAARGADSYAAALRAVLTSVRRELGVESAALLERRESVRDLRCLVGAGALEAATPTVAADGFLISRLRAYPLPLPFSPDELGALAEWAAVHRPERLDEIRSLAGADVRLAVPLRTPGEVLGVLLLGPRAHGAGFAQREKQILRACADQFALMIENARLTERVVEQETLRRDIALASDVQRRLLPDAPPRAEVADFAAISVPARRIGGDYYDFVELRDREIGIALADVSGKGVAAALIMSVVQASLRIISSERDVPPPHLVSRMNEFVYRSTPPSKYATFFYAQLDEQRRRLRYVNAGHNAPYLFRAGRASLDGTAAEIEQLSTGGTIVGMFPEMTYEEATIDLYPGDVLLAFTDGVPEAHSPDNEEFGEERLQELLRQTAHLPADEISARISAEMKNWIRDAEQYDDLTFIVMKVR